MEALLASLKHAARAACQRRLLVLSGERDWSRDKAVEVINFLDPETTVLVGEHWPGLDGLTLDRVIVANKARQLLGASTHNLIYDHWAGTDPEALAAVLGTVKGGGLVVLLTPPLDAWQDYHDPDFQRLLAYPHTEQSLHYRFLQHLAASIGAARDCVHICQGEALPASVPLPPPAQRQLTEGECLTQEQATAVAAIKHVLSGHRRRPLVITSDRGRGKSAALGIAAAQLLSEGRGPIWVTAPRPESVATVFEHAAAVLGVALDGPTTLYCGELQLKYVAPDELQRNRPDAQLLLVDEAAAIPAPLLEVFLTSYSRVVFATTVHGYEGSGRGFDIRFRKTLETLRPQWRALTLSEPIRWAPDDPVERWLFDALLLESTPGDVAAIDQLTLGQCVVEEITPAQLLDNPEDLGQLFGLLVAAHYQTSPADLRYLLDGPNIRISVTHYQGKLVAAALLAEEGDFDDAMAAAIWRGERRPRGHLLPQSLAVHAGLENAPRLRFLRVMRIAVHPELQRQGLGEQLIKAIVDGARQDGFDLVGSSFAATADVLAFWWQAQLVPVRIGSTRDASSGLHSAQVLSALTPAGDQLLMQARSRLLNQFPLALLSSYRQLDAELIAVLLRRGVLDDNAPSLEQQDWVDLEQFAAGGRELDMARYALRKLMIAVLANSGWYDQCSEQQWALLIGVALQGEPVTLIATRLQLQGKRAALDSIRQATAILLVALRVKINEAASGSE